MYFCVLFVCNWKLIGFLNVVRVVGFKVEFLGVLGLKLVVLKFWNVWFDVFRIVVIEVKVLIGVF